MPNKNGYLIVCSTFEAQQCGNFTLDIDSIPEKPLTIIKDFTNALEISKVEDIELLDSMSGGQPETKDD
jgi:hypothetical protein